MIDTVSYFILGYMALWALLMGVTAFWICRVIKLEKKIKALEA